MRSSDFYLPVSEIIEVFANAEAEDVYAAVEVLLEKNISLKCKNMFISILLIQHLVFLNLFFKNVFP